jgi:hypothetical protein
MSKDVPVARAVWARFLNLSNREEEQDTLDDIIACPVKLNIRSEDNEGGKEKKTHKSASGAPSTSSHGEEARGESHVAAPFALHPGFPQQGVPDKDAYRDHRDKQSARRLQDAEALSHAMIEARMRESEKLAHVVAPVAISYPLKDLQSSSRLMDGYKLDLSPGHVLSESMIQQVVNRAMERLRSLTVESPKPTTSYKDAVNAPPPPPPTSARAEAGSPPKSPPKQGIRRISFASPLTTPTVRAAVSAALASLLPGARADTIDKGDVHDDDPTHAIVSFTFMVGLIVVMYVVLQWAWTKIRRDHISRAFPIMLTCVAVRVVVLMAHSSQHHSKALGVLTVLCVTGAMAMSYIARSWHTRAARL